MQVASGLHYLPLTPIKYSLLLTGVVFSLNALAAELITGAKGWKMAVEPAVLLAVFGILTVIVK
jgi:hypothetical protein